jgi:trk system potassium uptake protein TrkA
LYCIIVGATGTGLQLATWLIDAGSEVTLIDPSETKCRSVEQQLGSITVVGDPTVIETLSRSGIERADLLISTLPEDDANLLISSVAKVVFNISQVISVINTSENKNIFSIMGLDQTIDSVGLISENVEEKIADLLTEEV